MEEEGTEQGAEYFKTQGNLPGLLKPLWSNTFQEVMMAKFTFWVSAML